MKQECSWGGARERERQYGQKCQRDIKHSLIMKPNISLQFSLQRFISEVYELHCRLESLLTASDRHCLHYETSGSLLGETVMKCSWVTSLSRPGAVSPTSSPCSSHALVPVVDCVVAVAALT